MKSKNNKSIFRILIKNLFLIINYLVLLLFVISLLSKYIPPDKLLLPAFLGLAYPYIFAILFLLFFMLIVRKYKIHVFIILPFVIYGLFLFTNYYKLNIFNSNKEHKNSIKIMSFNVRLFDLYNWKNNKHERDKIISLIKAENPDIICLQEYYYQNDNEFKTTNLLLDALKPIDIHTYFPIVNKSKYFFGIATLSKYKIVKKGQIVFNSTSNICIYTDVIINNDTVRIYNNHLESVRLGKEDYNFINKFDFNVEKNEIKDSKHILKRLKNAFIKRALQAKVVHNNIINNKYPVIVCGDFNDTPLSYAYNTISKNLNDAFIESGSGSGSTYNGKIPFLRIDYVLYSNYFNSYSFKVINKDLSDHFPITCYLYKSE